MTDFLSAVLGLALLAAGQRLFWLFVGAVGFTVGLQAATLIFGTESLWILWASGLVAGTVGALLAIFFQTLAIVAGGFMAGSLVVFHLMQHGGMAPHALIVLTGGAVGALALFLIFDWALILLSSMVGATLITEVAGLQFPAAPIVFTALCAAGVAVQGGWLLAVRKREH